MGDDAGQWVELRVHGVSGTPPESLLAHSHVAQVDGGESSRFFRPVDAANNEIRGSDGQVLEAYHWGKYTSGSWQQALWLTLVPFGLINAAQFMLPAAPTTPGLTARSALHSVAGAMLRFLALLLTELMVFATGLTLIDEVAWRWAPHSARFASWSTSLVFSLAVVGTAGVTVALYALGHGTGRRRTGEPSDKAGPAMPSRYDANRDREKSRTPLANPAFYEGSADAPTLRRLHLAAGLLLAAAMGRWARDAHAWAHRDATLLVALAVLVAVIVAVTVLGDPEGSASAVYAERAASIRLRWHAFVRVASWFAVAAGALLVFVAERQMPGVAPLRAGQPDRIETYDTIANVILFSGVSALSLLLLSCACLIPASRSSRLRKGSPSWYFRPYASGMTSALVACLAVFVGVGLSASVATAVSSSLGLAVKDKAYATGETVRVGVTPMLDRVAYAWGLTFLLLVALAIVFACRYALSYRTLARKATAMFERAAPVDPNGYARSWSSRQILAMWIARLKNHIPGIVWTLVGSGLVFSFAIAVELGLLGPDAASWWTGWSLVDKLSQPLAVPPRGAAGDSANVIAGVGVWLLLFAGTGLIVLARLGLREESSRRGINVIWDVVSFWPHAVHPFVPRPYSQSAVPDLNERIGQHLQTRSAGNRAVVVCGHSQGSLIGFAAISLLDDEDKRRVALLTFGSQLRLMFSRAFPAYMNFEAIAKLHGDLGGSWINLYRDTDPLAGPVLSWGHRGEGDQARSQHFPDPFAGPEYDTYATPARVRRSGHDWRLLDPAPRIAPGQVGPVNLLYKHSDYWLDPAWRDALMILHRS